MTMFDGSDEGDHGGHGALEELAEILSECRAALADLAEAVGREHRVRAEELSYRVERHAPRIMVVGQVKAGKTALANALAGVGDLLPTDVNPATSAVTSLHLNQPWRQPPASFVFFDHADWDSLTTEGGRLGALARRVGNEEEAEEIARQMRALQDRARERLGARYEKLVGGRHNFDHVDPGLLRRYVCLGDEEGDLRSGRFAELTREAHIRVPAPDWPMAVTLIDTPGVNDPFLVREQMTLAALAETDLCVVVLSAHQAMTTVDLALFRLLSGLRADQAILFVNRVDELDDPVVQTREIAESLHRALAHAGIEEDPALMFGSAVESPQDPASGIAPLRAALGARLMRGRSARPVLDALAEAQVIARQARSLASVEVAQLDEDEIVRRMAPLAAEAHDTLDAAVEEGWVELREGLQRLVDEFTEAECSRMEEGLRDGVRLGVWTVDTTQLRFRMNERYGAFSAQVTAEAATALGRLARRVGEVYADAVGEDSVHPEAPPVPEMPAPVTFSQIMSIDADLGWWRRLFGVGIRDRVEKLREALRLEALSLVTELGATQVPQFARALETVTREFAETHATALVELASSPKGRSTPVPDRLGGIEERLAGLTRRLHRAEEP